MKNVILILTGSDCFVKNSDKIDFERKIREKILTKDVIIKFSYLISLKGKDFEKLVSKEKPNTIFFGEGFPEVEILKSILFLILKIPNVTLLSKMEIRGIKKIGSISEIKNYANELSPV